MKQKANDILDLNEEEILDQIEKESIHDGTCVEKDINAYVDNDEDILSSEEILDLLDIEYWKYVEKNGPIFVLNPPK